MFFVCLAVLHNFAFKFITFILTVNFAITAGHKGDTVSVVARVLVKIAGAKAHPFDLSATREAAEVISHLPIVVAKNKAGELGLARGHSFRTCPPEKTQTPSLTTSNFHGPLW